MVIMQSPAEAGYRSCQVSAQRVSESAVDLETVDWRLQSKGQFEHGSLQCLIAARAECMM